MKKKNIAQIVMITVALIVTISTIFSIGAFLGKGQEVAATTTPATDTVTSTSNTTGTKVSLGDTAVISYKINPIDTLNNEQTVKLSDTVKVVLPSGFIRYDRIVGGYLAGGYKIRVIYYVSSFNIAYNKLEVNSDAETILNKYSYKPVSSLYDFYFIQTAYDSNNESLVTNFDKPISITFSLSDSELSGLDKSKLKVLYFTEDGDIQEMPTTVNGNDVTFTTTHFSRFMIGEVKDSTTRLNSSTNGVKTSDSNNILGIISFTLGSIIIATTVIMVGTNKKNKEIN